MQISSHAHRLAPVIHHAQQLHQLFMVEREFVRTVTTLIPRLGTPEIKYMLCQHAWESTQHAQFLLGRGREMNGFGNPDQVPTAFRRIFEEALRAPTPLATLQSFYQVLKPALLAAYQHYLATTSALGDWPTTHLLTEFVLDEVRHVREADVFLAHGAPCPTWNQHIQAALAAQGGWLAQDPQPLPEEYVWFVDQQVYRHPTTPARDYPTGWTAFGDDPQEDAICASWLTDPATDAGIIRVMVYVWLMNEMDAVDYLATVFYDTPDVTFDVHHDLARHLWDESRHSQFGFRMLPRLGIDLHTVEQQVGLYDVLVQLSPAERYALMTMEFEARSFGTKAIVMDRVHELDDFESDTLLAFDRNDEQNHVRFGHRWLPTLLASVGETRPIPDFLAAARDHFAEVERTTTIVAHTLPREDRLTATKIRAQVQRHQSTL